MLVELQVPLGAHRDPRPGVAQSVHRPPPCAGRGCSSRAPEWPARPPRRSRQPYTGLPVIGVPLHVVESVMGGLNALLSIVHAAGSTDRLRLGEQRPDATILAAKILTQAAVTQTPATPPTSSSLPRSLQLAAWRIARYPRPPRLKASGQEGKARRAGSRWSWPRSRPGPRSGAIPAEAAAEGGAAPRPDAKRVAEIEERTRPRPGRLRRRRGRERRRLGTLVPLRAHLVGRPRHRRRAPGAGGRLRSSSTASIGQSAVIAPARSTDDAVMVGRHARRPRRADHLRAQAGWLGDEMRRDLARLTDAQTDIAVGKISRRRSVRYALGTAEGRGARLRQPGAGRDAVSTQVVSRDRHALFVSTLAIIAASLEKFATEIRHLQRTEVLEAEEPFAEGQTGSSAMPHKRNPEKCERICGLARLLRGYATSAWRTWRSGTSATYRTRRSSG